MQHSRSAGPGVPGDTRVAGTPPKPSGADASELEQDTAPDPMPPVGLAEDEVAKDFPRPRAAERSTTPDETPGRQGGTPERILAPPEADRFRQRWREVQSGFIDDPGDAVRKADELASEVAAALVRSLAARRRSLSEPLENGKGEGPDTERLRLAIRDYRDLLDRLLTA